MRRVASLGLLLSLAGCAARPALMVVARPVVDLRRQPQTSPAAGTHDPFEETQLLYGERVRVVATEDGWAKVEAVEQNEYTTRRRWQGYPGWAPLHSLVPWGVVWDPNVVVTAKWAPMWQEPYKMRPAAFRLPIGAMVRATDIGRQRWKVELVDGSSGWIEHDDARSLQELQTLPVSAQRRLILRAAEAFLGDPYFWGGRSPYAGTPEDQVTGVDCSGLVNLAYRTVGRTIPRDAHEQFLKARPVTALEPADLIFLSEPGNPQRIVHVMLYAGGGQVIEGPGTGHAVRRIALAERLGQPFDQLVSDLSMANGQTVYFGAYLQ